MSGSDGTAPHVLVVTPGFPPDPGGVEEHTGHLVTELVGLGWRVSVLTARRGVRRTVVEHRGGARVVVVPAWRSTVLSLSPRLLGRALAAGGDVDLLHVHSYHALTGLAVLNPRLRGRVVFTPHYHGRGHSPLARVLHLGYRRLGALLFSRAAAVVCVSEAERSALETDVPDVADRTEVIGNGVDVDGLRAAAAYEGEPPTVLVAGRLEPYKGVAHVVEALAQLPTAVQLVVIGDGSQREALTAQAARLGLEDRVRLLGAVERAVVDRWLRTAAVLVSASAHEAFGMAPLEAAAAGAPVVLSDIPAHREIAARHLGSAATLVDARAPAALAEALRTRLAEPGRVEVEVPRWRDVAVATAGVYRRVLDASRTDAGASRPVGLLDLPWFDHWSVVVTGPLELPSPEALRATLLRYLERYPDAPLGSTVDARTRRWLPVPPSARSAHVHRLVQSVPHVDLSAVAEHVETFRPAPDSDLVFTCVLSPDTLTVYHRHVNGDAATFALAVLALARADEAGLVALGTRVTLPQVGRSLLHQPREVYAGWARRGLDGLPVPALRTAAPRPSFQDPPRQASPRQASPRQASPRQDGSTPLPRGTSRRSSGVGQADQVMTNAELRALTRWRNEHHRGVSVNAVLATWVHAALRAEGLPMRTDAFYSLFDVRGLLGEQPGFLAGNLAKSVLVEADLTDPAAVDQALRTTMGTRRALPALAIGAFGSLGASPGRVDPAPGAAVVEQVVLSFSSMPSLAGLEGLPWTSPTGRRYVGLGYTTGPDGVSVFALRFRDRLELAAGFDRALADPATVQRALRRVASGQPPD